MIDKDKTNNLEKSWKLVNFCEFDKYAVKSYCAIHNVDEGLNLGDITKVDETKLEDFNMICGGSPCQDFSVAGKQKGSVWTCKDCRHEYNPLTVHWSKRGKCPNCDSENIEKTRSSLLVEYLRVVREKKPNFGIYENVKNIVGKQFRDTTFKLFEDELHEYEYNTYWKVLNSKDYGVPQNRERVYLIFIRKDLDNGKFVFPEGFDNGIRLKDVLEDEVDEKYYISDEKVEKFLSNLNFDDICSNRNTLKIDGNNFNQRCVVHTPNDVSRTLIGSGGSGGYHAGNEPKVLVETNNKCNDAKFIGNINRADFGTGYAGGVWDSDYISPTLTTMQGGGRQPHVMQTGIDKSLNDTKVIDNANCITAREDRGISNRKAEGTAVLETPDISYCLDANYYKGTTPEQYVERKRRQLVFENEVKKLEKQVLETNSSIVEFSENNNVVRVKQATKKGYIECEIGGVADLSYPKSKLRRGRVQDGGNISPTLTTSPGIYRLESPIRIRKLTPKECFRLMGFDDSAYEAASNVVSNSQLYKQAGNSIVVDVLYYIFVELYKAMPYLFDDLRLSSFFSGIGAFEAGLDRLYESINTGNFPDPQAE